MNQELFTRARQLGGDPLRDLTAAAHNDVVAVLAAAIVRPQALELADALEGEPLETLREKAAPYLAAIAAAKEALTEEQQSIAGRLAAFWASKKRGDANDKEREPDRDTQQVLTLKAALSKATQEASAPASQVRSFEYTIAGLRAAPTPDPTVLAALAEAQKVEVEVSP